MVEVALDEKVCPESLLRVIIRVRLGGLMVL